MIGINSTLRNSRLVLIKNAIDNNSTGKLLIYSGDRPETGDFVDEYDNVLLVPFDIPNPCGDILNGILTFNSISMAIVINYGIASWARILDGDNGFVMDLSVSDMLGNGDVKLDYLEVFADMEVSCALAKITEGN